MSFYPPKIQARFINPQNAGEILNADAVGNAGSFVCGAVLRFYLRAENEKIVAARFKSAGCGYLSAAADLWCEKIVGKTLAEIDAVQIEAELSSFPAAKKHCLELIFDAAAAAKRHLRTNRLADWNGDEILICTCFGVSEKTIAAVIAENNLDSVSQVTKLCRAGGGCGSCQVLIQDILDDSQHDF